MSQRYKKQKHPIPLLIFFAAVSLEGRTSDENKVCKSKPCGQDHSPKKHLAKRDVLMEKTKES